MKDKIAINSQVSLGYKNAAISFDVKSIDRLPLVLLLTVIGIGFAAKYVK